MEATIEGKTFIKGDFLNCCLGIKDGKISKIKKVLKKDTHYNFGTKLILPAGIDIHVHFRDPGMTYKEDFSTGSLSAACGGVSCVFDMPNTNPSTTSVQTLSDKIRSASKKSFVDFGIYAGITNDNLKNIKELTQKCNGFKIYLGSTTNSLLLDEKKLEESIKNITSSSKPVLIHAENNKCLNKHKIIENNIVDHLQSRPVVCEEISIKSILRTAKVYKNRKIHICHLSSCEGLELLRNRLKNISVGATPHHLFFNVEKKIQIPNLL